MLSTMQMVLQISKIVIQADTFIGQLIHKVEVAQFDSVKKGQHMVRIFMGIYRKFVSKYGFIIFHTIGK